MGTAEAIVDIDAVVMQAWRSKGIEAMRREVFRRLVEAQGELVERLRQEGKQAYRWGYACRKMLLTPWGDVGPIRIPRVRLEGREVRLIPRQIRRIESLDRLAGEATLAGISQRRVGVWLRHSTGQSMSAATVGEIVQRLSEQLKRERERPFYPGEYVALAVDGVWGKYRGRGEGVLLVAGGVRWEGSFDVLDWEAAPSESSDASERLLTRLWLRGLTGLKLLVGDGAGAIRSAKELVYPEAEFQLCLWHWGRTLRRYVSPPRRREFSRDFWEVYNGLDGAEVERRAREFKRRWKKEDPLAVKMFEERYPETVGYLQFPERWRHRVRTVNLAEGFFRNFERFFSRYPGVKDEDHFSRVMGLYLLGAKPERWRPRQLRLRWNGVSEAVA